MVALTIPDARESTGPRARARGPFSALFLAWRRVVTAWVRGIARGFLALGASRPARMARATAGYLRDPRGALAAASPAQRALLVEAGVVALALGAAASFLVPGSLSTGLVRRFLGVGWIAAWALGRLFIMRSIAGGGGSRARAVDDAWGPALTPFVLAIADPLPFLALGVSALLTAIGLEARGFDRHRARRLVAWAFGAQLVGEVALWLGRGGLVYLLALRS